MTTEERNRLRELHAKATPGPWKADWQGTNHFELTGASREYWISLPDSGIQRGEDLDCIAETHNALPALLDDLDAKDRRIALLESAMPDLEDERDEEIERLRGDVANLRECLEQSSQVVEALLDTVDMIKEGKPPRASEQVISEIVAMARVWSNAETKKRETSKVLEATNG